MMLRFFAFIIIRTSSVIMPKNHDEYQDKVDTGQKLQRIGLCEFV